MIPNGIPGLQGQAGTAGNALGVPRQLGFQRTPNGGYGRITDGISEAPATSSQPYARNGAQQTWQLLTGATQQLPPFGTGWTAGQVINWRLTEGGDCVQVSAVLTRAAGSNIPPGAGANITLCTLPVRPLSQQLQVCAALAQTGLGSLPGDQISYGYILLSTTGVLAFYGHAPNDQPAIVNGTSTIYISNTFPLTMLGASFDPLTESRVPPTEPPHSSASWWHPMGGKILRMIQFMAG